MKFQLPELGNWGGCALSYSFAWCDSFTVYDALRRKFQCATVQLDFQLPIRFDLNYATETGLERPVIVHRAVLGSVERMFAILTEHFAGKWPLWLSPRQAMVVPISESSYEYAHEVRSLTWGSSGQNCY